MEIKKKFCQAVHIMQAYLNENEVDLFQLYCKPEHEIQIV